MGKRSWTAYDWLVILGVSAAVLSAIVVLAGNAGWPVKVAAIVGMVGAFWWGRAEGWDDRSPKS